jgi:hypothetical protein
MTRMLVIIVAVLALAWVPSQASHISATQVSVQAVPSPAVTMPNRFSGTALR